MINRCINDSCKFYDETFNSNCNKYISHYDTCLQYRQEDEFKISQKPGIGNLDCSNGGIGIKHDIGKARWDLLPWKQLSEVVEILTFGAKKYTDDNWKNVDNHKQRYFSAAMRHMTAWFCGEKNDTESGKSHLAHAICCLFFLMWFDDK